MNMTNPLENLYYYKARVVRVVDGDTFDLDIDLGLHLTVRKRIRLLGVDTPEIRGVNKDPLGETAKQYVIDRIGGGKSRSGEVVVIRTQLDHTDKYGRLLCEIYYKNKQENEIDYSNLTKDLIAEGLVKR